MSFADIYSAMDAVKSISASFDQLKAILEAGLAEQRKQTALLEEQNEWLRRLSLAVTPQQRVA